MIAKMEILGHDGYHALDEKKNQGMFCWWNKEYGKVVLYETWRKKDGEIKPAWGKRKSKSGMCLKNVNFIPALAEEIAKIIGLVAGVDVSEATPQPKKSGVEKTSAEYDLKKDIRKLGV